MKTRAWLQAGAMLTQLVYNHALRVRVKADVDSSSTEGSSTGKPSPNSKNFSGKLFTLATSDIQNLLEGREFLQICTCRLIRIGRYSQLDLQYSRLSRSEAA